MVVHVLSTATTHQLIKGIVSRLLVQQTGVPESKLILQIFKQYVQFFVSTVPATSDCERALKVMQPFAWWMLKSFFFV